MSQEEIFNVIQKSSKPLSSKDIQKKTKLSSSPVQNSLAILLKWKEIKCVEKIVNKHKMRFYFV